MNDKYPLELNIKLDLINRKGIVSIKKNNMTSETNDLIILNDSVESTTNESSNKLIFTSPSLAKENIIYGIFVLKNYKSSINYNFISLDYSEDDYKLYNKLAGSLKTYKSRFINNFFNKKKADSVFESADSINEIIILNKALKYSISNNLKFIILLRDYLKPSEKINELINSLSNFYTKNNNKICIFKYNNDNKSTIINNIKIISFPIYYYQKLLKLSNSYKHNLNNIYKQILSLYNNDIIICNNNIFN